MQKYPSNTTRFLSVYLLNNFLRIFFCSSTMKILTALYVPRIQVSDYHYPCTTNNSWLYFFESVLTSFPLKKNRIKYKTHHFFHFPLVSSRYYFYFLFLHRSSSVYLTAILFGCSFFPQIIIVL